MIDKRVGKRFKEYREKLGLTQEEFAEKVNVATTYISAIERGTSFPRFEKLVAILNGLEISADAVLCDVLKYPCPQQTQKTLDGLSELKAEDQKRILDTVAFMIKQTKDNY